jgi:phosphatidylserine/phosphatidylglycerophosphate/cardiolipin synthase-like enzyme
MNGMLNKDDWLRRLDDRIGDGLEAVIRRHHRRRLRRLGWADALAPPDGPDWWSPRVERRTGNSVQVLIDGATALPEMERAIRGAQQFVHIANWHASPDFALSREPGAPTLRNLLAEVSARVPVRLLLWAGPPLPVFKPTRRMVKQAKLDFMSDSHVHCALDARERTMHCHHEKILIVDDVVAFVGGIDFTALEGDRYDESEHPPTEPMGWHDLAVKLRGPAVVDVARHFVQRWSEVTGEILADSSEPPPEGDTEVQVLRTVPERTYTFAPDGDFTIMEAYMRALRSAEHFVYLENQFLWSPEIVDALADKLAHPPRPDFRILLLLPARPSDGKESTRGQLGRLLEADGQGGHLLATTISGHRAGTTAPVYVHAKAGIVDDRWLTIGSANLNEHSLLNDTEMNIVTCDADLARETRLRLWAEHTEQPIPAIDGDPGAVIDSVWRKTAEEQSRLDREGLPRTHRLTLLPSVSRRTDRLEGPIRGLLVDG